MSSNGSVDRLLKRLLLLPATLNKSRTVSTLCHSCLRSQQLKKNHFGGRFDAITATTTTTTTTAMTIRKVPSRSPLTPSIGYHRSLLLSRFYSTDLPGLPPNDRNDHSRSIADNKEPVKQINGKQRDASTSIAMIHYAKQGNPDQCLHHYLHLLQSQGTLPSHEALHQLARVLYLKRHIAGFSILHDTLLAYYTLNPPSGRQARNLTYIYTMFINLIIQQRQQHQKPNSQKHSRRSIKPQQQSDIAFASTLSKKTATVIQLCQEMHQLGLPGSSVLYNTLLKFCVIKNDWDAAWSLYDELVLRCKPTQYTYSILLDLARRQQPQDERILEILDSVEKTGVMVDRTMVSTIMLVLCDQRQYTSAAEFLDQLARLAPHIMGPKYQAVLVDTLLRHSRQQYTQMATKRLRQYKRKYKRKYKRQLVGQSRLDKIE